MTRVSLSHRGYAQLSMVGVELCSALLDFVVVVGGPRTSDIMVSMRPAPSGRLAHFRWSAPRWERAPATAVLLKAVRWEGSPGEGGRGVIRRSLPDGAAENARHDVC